MNHSLYTDPHQKRLLKKWNFLIESGSTPIQDEQSKVVLAQVLENTRNYFINQGMLNEAGVSQADVIGKRSADGGYMTGGDNVPYRSGNYGDYYLPNVVMPMLRRIMPDLMANELVSVQPLNNPVGFALAFRPQLKNSFITGSDGKVYGREIGYNPTDVRYTGMSADNTQFGEAPEAGNDAWDYYAGTAAERATNGDIYNGQGMDLADAEWMNLDGTYNGHGAKQPYPEVTFGLTKSTVTAKTRKLAAQWSPELAEDMQAMHGIDVEREMINTLTYEVGAEIDRQIISEMVKAAIVGGSVTSWDPVSADGLDQMGRLTTLLTQIAIEANNIAIRTKRGNANFVITTPRVCALLEQLGMNKFTSFKSSASMPSVPDSGVGALAKIGLINNDQQLLIRDASTQANDKDYILMGYKGKNVGDSGIIYCPYIPLQLNKIMQPGTFSYSIGARTRYGVMNNPFEAKNYYAFMKIENMWNGYTWGGQRHFISTPSQLQVNGWKAGSPVVPETARVNPFA